MTGYELDYNLHARLEFGEYVQTHEETVTSMDQQQALDDQNTGVSGQITGVEVETVEDDEVENDRVTECDRFLEAEQTGRTAADADAELPKRQRHKYRDNAFEYVHNISQEMDSRNTPALVNSESRS
jgi:hypothetical protein